MSGYVKETLKRLQHVPEVYPQYSPHKHIPIVYGKKNTQQYATSPDESSLLNIIDNTYIQSVVWSFLYYARAIDGTILPGLNDTNNQQAQPTEVTRTRAQKLVDYTDTYLDAFIRYHASDMQLQMDSDAAYLVLPKAKSRIVGYYYFGKLDGQFNEPVRIECWTIK